MPDVNLARPSPSRRPRRRARRRPPARWCGDERPPTTRPTPFPPECGPVQGRVRLRRRSAEPVRRLPGRAAGERRDHERFLSAQSGGTKAIRFDMGTRCGPGTSTSRWSRSPGRAPTTPATSTRSPRRSGARSASGRSAQHRDPRRQAVAGSAWSSGSARRSWARRASSPAPANPHNRGGLRSVLFTRDGEPPRPAPPAAAGGPRASCTRSHTTSAPCSGAPRTRPRPPASEQPATATAGRAPT